MESTRKVVVVDRWEDLTEQLIRLAYSEAWKVLLILAEVPGAAVEAGARDWRVPARRDSLLVVRADPEPEAEEGVPPRFGVSAGRVARRVIRVLARV